MIKKIKGVECVGVKTHSAKDFQEVKEFYRGYVKAIEGKTIWVEVAPRKTASNRT